MKNSPKHLTIQLTDWCTSGPQWLHNTFSCKSENKNQYSCKTVVIQATLISLSLAVWRSSVQSISLSRMFTAVGGKITFTQDTKHQYSHIYWYNYSKMKGIVQAKNDRWRRSFLFCFCESSQRRKQNHRMTLKRKKTTTHHFLSESTTKRKLDLLLSFSCHWTQIFRRWPWLTVSCNFCCGSGEKPQCQQVLPPSVFLSTTDKQFIISCWGSRYENKSWIVNSK